MEKKIRYNRAAALIFETDIKKMIGMSVDRLFFGKKYRRGLLSQLHGEVTFPELEGWFDISSYPVYLEDQHHGLVYIIKDVTSKKQIELSLVASQNLADIGTLAAGIAHEIKSPLQVIIGLSEARLLRLKQNEVDINYLIQGFETINRNGWRMADIVKSLLNYARSSGKQMDYYNLNEMVRETLLLIGHQLQVWSKIKIENDLGNDLPLFFCEKNKIEQVLINLLSNARDAMPYGGTIIIKTDYEADKNRFVLQVSDTGTGISDELRGKIFEPFFTTKASGQGTGLGLSIVMGIVREHDGEIKLDSTPQKGATFTIYFPKIN